MRILIIIPDKQVGGGQIFALRLAEALATRHDVFVLAAEPGWRDESPPEIPATVTEIDLLSKGMDKFLNQGVRKSTNLLGKILPCSGRFFAVLQGHWEAWQKKRSFSRLLKDHRIDIVNTHVWWADYFASRYLDPSLEIPWVITMHGCYEYCVNNPKQFPNFSADSYKALSKAKKIIFISEKNLEIFKHILNKVPTHKIVKIYNGFARTEIDPVDLTPLGVVAGDFKLGLVSRAIPEKGWETAILATRLAREETSKPIHLFLLGESDFQRELAQKYDWPFIHFVGYISRPLDWISTFDLGLLPTYFPSESLPNSVVEYLSCGKPVVATDMGEIRFMIDAEGQPAGKLIDFDENGKPETNALKDAIVSYMLDSLLLENHSKLAEIAFVKFAMEKCISAYEEVFNDALSQET